MFASPILKVFLLSLVVSASASPRGSTRGAVHNLNGKVDKDGHGDHFATNFRFLKKEDKEEDMDGDDYDDEDYDDEDWGDDEDAGQTDFASELEVDGIDGIFFPEEPVMDLSTIPETFPEMDENMTLTMPETQEEAVAAENLTMPEVDTTPEVVVVNPSAEVTPEAAPETPVVEAAPEAAPETPVVEAPYMPVMTPDIDEASGSVSIAYSVSMQVGGQAFTRDLGLSEYLNSNLIEKYPTLTGVSVTLSDFEGNVVHYDIDVTFSSPETTGEVQRDIAALLGDTGALNAYWASKGSAVGNGLVAREVTLPDPEPVYVENVMLHNFTVTVQGRPAAQDLGLPAYLMQRMSATPVENIYIEMYDYNGGNDVNYMGYANFSEPVNPDTVHELQKEIFEDLATLNYYYAETEDINGPISFSAVVVHSGDDLTPSELLSTDETAYDIDLANFVAIVEGTGNSLVEDLGLSDYVEDIMRESMPEIIDVTFIATPNEENPAEVMFSDGIATFRITDGAQYERQMVVAAQTAILENTDAINAYWASDSDVDLRLKSINVQKPRFRGVKTEPWVIGVSTAAAVVGCLLLVFMKWFCSRSR